MSAPLAIVGIGCRFPGGANSPEAFWRLLCDGVDAVGEVPPDRYDLAEFFDADPGESGKLYTRWGGFVEGVDRFDADFFGFSPREASRIDPQHRLLLEVTHEAFEDAGLSLDNLAGSPVGVFVGVSTHDYGDIQMWPENRDDIDAHSNTGTATAIAANRISYSFDLRGPSFVVDTACSSSLTALHLAARALENGECETVVVGAAQLLLTPEPTIGFCKAAMISPDGRCRAFAAAANGYVRSEGAGALVLKPLEAALAAQDRIHAVVAATAVNQDGRTNGMTVPSPEAQQAMIVAALGRACLEPADVQYVEAHGTGTPVGDPIEAAAIGAAIGDGRAEPVAIGSAKTNLGHLEAAAGMAGLVKAALALRHGQLPPTLHFVEPSPAIDFEALRLRVVAELEPWPPLPPGTTRTAVVNSFGFGGSNGAAVLQAPPAAEADEMPRGRVHVLPVSARSEGALDAAARAYAELLAADAVPAGELCAAAALRRGHHDQRLAVVGETAHELAEGLEAFLSDEHRAGVATGRRSPGTGKLAFVFSGMGAQWARMGRRLLEEEPVFAASIRRSDASLRELAGWNLIEDLLADDDHTRVRDGDFAQVSNFAVQAALFELWARWGIRPDACVGHSAGEIAAAYACGALGFEQAALLAYHRGRLQFRATGKGRMLALAVPRAEAEELVAGLDGVELAAVNAPASVTLSGDAEVLEELRRSFEERQVFARIVPVDIPYHSAKMDPIRDELLESLSVLTPVDGTVPFASVVSGAWLGGAELDAAYWWRNIRQPVLFADAVELLAEEGCTTFLEVAPHPVLASSVAEILAARGVRGTVLPSMRRGEDDLLVARRSLAALYAEGREVDWEAAVGGRTAHVELPKYAWQRERHWFEPRDNGGRTARSPAGEPGPHPLLARRLRTPRHTWETCLGEGSLTYLSDHVIGNSVLFPGAAYAEMGLAAAREILETETPVVRSLDLERALFVDVEAAVQLVVDADGRRFEVSSGGEAGGPWTRHARGVLGSAELNGSCSSESADAIRSRCLPELDRDGFYMRLATGGYAYGPAFQGVERAWSGEREALGLVRLPPGTLDVDGYGLHPALLDAALQLLILAAGDDARGTFLPVRIDELAVHSPPGAEFWAHARVDAAGESGSVRLLEESGTTHAEVRGLRWTFVEPAERPRQDDWLYEPRWEPKTPPGARSALAESAVGTVGLPVDTGWDEYYAAAEPLLEEAAAGAARAALDGLDEAAIPEGVRRLSSALRRGVETYGPGPADPTRALDELRTRLPHFALDADLLERCSAALPGVLRGEQHALDVLLSGPGLALLERFYAEAPSARFYDGLLADAVGRLARQAPEGRTLRVLEIGAGTGGTTAYLLPQLPADRTRYLFTDVSPLFLARARERFSDCAFLETALFDAERDPSDQGLERESFDLVVAANVLHATSRLEDTLGRVSELLAPEGVLVLLEITRRPLWLDVVFGLTEGWWAFADPELRPAHALLDKERWQTLLAEAGFEDVAALADEPPSGEPGQTVFFARTTARSEPREPAGHWLLLADRSGVGVSLAERLSAAGATSTLVHYGDEYVEGVKGGALRGVVHLWSLDAPEDPIEAQAYGALSVLELLRRVDLPGHGAELVIATAGAQESPTGMPRRPAASLLWGLGRVLFKERPDVRCRLVELGSDPGAAELDAFAAELLGPSDAEPEVALAGGARLVRRLERLPLAEFAPHQELRTAVPEDAYRAKIAVPGVLDTLVLEEFELRPPGPGEVQIRVGAAGLNFRDVMFAMGLLPELALAETAGTDRIGLDCAGVVTAVGAGVTQLAVGDDVFGVAYGCAGSFATANAALVVRRPPALDAEAAATAPVAFATARMALVELARIGPGERVLIHAASGGVGLAALQVAREAGAEVIATAGSEEKRAYLRSLGIAHVFDSRSLAFADGVLDCTGGRGVDVVLNSLAGEAIERGLGVLAPYGRFVEIGKRDVYEDSRIGLLAFRKNLSYFALDLDRMAAERPALLGSTLATIADKLADGTYEPLPVTAFPIGELEAAIRLLAQARHIGKVVVRVEGEDARITAPPEARPTVRPDGTYLITGGLGGFGLATAKWLVDEGARTLVLVGRSEPSQEARAAVGRLVEAGAHVDVIRGDVSSLDDVREILSRVRAELPPLRGVLHAAMALDDAAIEDLDEERFCRPLAAKAEGAWHLHRETLADELDLFVCFSSIAGVLGNPFQASYAAAGAYLDALAHHRHGLGLPALSVDWGVLSGIGYVSQREELAAYLERQGFLGFAHEDALHVLGNLLRGDRPQVVVARVDWQRHAQFAPAWAGAPVVRHLVPAADGVPGDDDGAAGSARAALLAGDPAGLEARALEYVRGRLGRVLGVRPDRIEPDRALTDIGLDSLLAVELMTALKTEVGVELPVVRLLQGVTVSGLASLVVEQLPQSGAREQVPPAAREPVTLPSVNGSAVSEPVLVTPETVVADLDGPGELYRSLDYTQWKRSQRLVKSLVRAGFAGAAKVSVEGLDHLPHEGGFVLATNHLSMADVPLLLTVMPRPTIIYATEELRTWPWLHWFLSDLGNAIYVRKGTGDERALALGVTVLEAGGVVALGPEGRRSQTGALERANTGVAYLARGGNVPVVPVATWGQEQIASSLRRLRRRAVHIRFGVPLTPPGSAAEPAELREFADGVMTEIARLLPAEYRGVYGTAVT